MGVWNVVEGWLGGRPKLTMELEVDPDTGWITIEKAKELFAACGQDFDELKQAAVKKDFQPVALNAKASSVNKEAKKISEKINEEELQARFDRYEQLSKAVKALEDKRRSPVFVLHEMANILTQGKLPDIDEAEQRQRVALDPEASLDLEWDGKSVWLESVVEEEGDVLAVVGAARDASDLSEFVKRLRSLCRTL